MDQNRKANSVNLFISPHPSEYNEDGAGSGGIWRVINAQARWLPECGVDIVDSEEDADVVCVHAGALVQTNKPIVTVNHGLYWTGDLDWPREQWQWNLPVIEALREAHKIIVPSEWVAQPIKRDMRKVPVVIPHGIDIDGFEPQQHEGYVLWAKPRVDVVSDPKPVNELAARALNVNFLTTFGRPAQNVQVIGVKPYGEFQEVLSRAMVWLATTRETGDIASREAMAFGVPVLGWDWGATGELVTHGETGYLAKPGDYDDLLQGLRFCTENRSELGKNARQCAQERFQWRDVMEKYAAVIHDAYDADQYEVEVSVVIPAYNYANYLPECIESVRRQDFDSVEIVVVDDASTDNTQDVLSQYEGLRVIRHTSNGGLVSSLNTGHEEAQGRYIMNLDADNVLTKGAIRKLWEAMEAKPWVDVGTGLYSIYGQEIANGGDVDYKAHLDHSNQIPSTCMIRSRSIRHLGGYRARQIKNEDAEFWCRAMSAGLRCEYLVGDPIFAYRWHGQNKTITEGGEDEPESPDSWNFYYPWRTFPDITPFACLTKSPHHSHKVRSYEQPHIAVIIPVGPGHEYFLVDALDSVYAQTFREFECIVANDTGHPLDVAALGHPWVAIVETSGTVGPATARNMAIEKAKAPLIVPLDADDLMFPDTLTMYYQAWLQYPNSIVYADCFTEDEPGKRIHYHSGPWSWDKIKREAVYQNVILFPKQWWEAVGGYPTDQLDNMWEDWLFGVKLHIMGVGATYIKDHVWGSYRKWPASASGASKNSVDNAGYGTKEFKDKYKQLLQWVEQKEETMPCKGCGNKAKTRVVVPFSHRSEPLPDGEQMQVVCTHPGITAFISMNSRAVRGKKYRYKTGTILAVEIGDEWMERHKHFERHTPEPQGVAAELPSAPPSPPKLPFPVENKVPVTAKKRPTTKSEDPDKKKCPVCGAQNEHWWTVCRKCQSDLSTEQADPSVFELGLSEALAQKLDTGGFRTKLALRNDILKTAGKSIKAIRGIGPKALIEIKTAVFG
jgi:glycosyltransferase involved in cell wall biosynthesis/ribosomal protein L40E